MKTIPVPAECIVNFIFITNLHRWKAFAKAGKFQKIPIKEDDTAHVEQLQSRLLKATEKKQTAKSVEDRLSAAALLEDAKVLLKAVRADCDVA